MKGWGIAGEKTDALARPDETPKNSGVATSDGAPADLTATEGWVLVQAANVVKEGIVDAARMNSQAAERVAKQQVDLAKELEPKRMASAEKRLRYVLVALGLVVGLVIAAFWHLSLNGHGDDAKILLGLGLALLAGPTLGTVFKGALGGGEPPSRPG